MSWPRVFLCFITFVLLMISLDGTAQPTKIVFSVNAPGTKPYLYFDVKSNTYQGIVVDFFASIDQENAMSIEYLDTSRNRYEKTLRSKQADLFLSAKDWLQTPEAYLFSNTIALQQSHFYATQPFAESFDLNALQPTTICTRTNFMYPTLDKSFQTGRLMRLDSTDQSTMTAMLLKGRCQYLVIGKEDAHAELFNAQYCDEVFFESPQVISSVKMVFVIRQDRLDLLKILNQQLQQFVASGQLDASFLKHIGTSNFPKMQCASVSA